MSEEEVVQPKGWAEILRFNPRDCTGLIAVVTIDENDEPIEVTREFHEAGGLIEWNGNPDAVPLIDRYREHRRKVLERYPKGYPIEDVGLVNIGASTTFGQRLRQKRAEALLEWLDAHEEELKAIPEEDDE